MSNVYNHNQKEKLIVEMKLTFFTQLTIAAMCARQCYAQVTAYDYLDLAQQYSDSAMFAEDGTVGDDLIGYGQLEGEMTGDEGDNEQILADSGSGSASDSSDDPEVEYA